jgi:hypothetical protein
VEVTLIDGPHPGRTVLAYGPGQYAVCLCHGKDGRYVWWRPAADGVLVWRQEPDRTVQEALPWN